MTGCAGVAGERNDQRGRALRSWLTTAALKDGRLTTASGDHTGLCKSGYPAVRATRPGPVRRTSAMRPLHRAAGAVSGPRVPADGRPSTAGGAPAAFALPLSGPGSAATATSCPTPRSSSWPRAGRPSCPCCRASSWPGTLRRASRSVPGHRRRGALPRRCGPAAGR